MLSIEARIPPGRTLGGSMNQTTPAPSTLTPAMARQRHPAVGRNRLYQAIRTGALRGVRVGRRTAIDVMELDDWVRAGCPIEPTSVASQGQPTSLKRAAS